MAKDKKTDEPTVVVNPNQTFDVAEHNSRTGQLNPIAEVEGTLTTAFGERGAVSVLQVEKVRPPTEQTRQTFRMGGAYTPEEKGIGEKRPDMAELLLGNRYKSGGKETIH